MEHALEEQPEPDEEPQPGQEDGPAVPDEPALPREDAVHDHREAHAAGRDERPGVGPRRVEAGAVLEGEDQPHDRHDAARDRQAYAPR